MSMIALLSAPSTPGDNASEQSGNRVEKTSERVKNVPIVDIHDIWTKNHP